MDGYVLAQHRAHSFYPVFDRKPDAQHQTHYCPGCGHGILHKLIARAIDELGIQDRTIFVSPVGCAVFGYYYFDVGNIQAAHGRAAAVATAVKRTRPQSIVISYQGDGDLAAIGSAEILHAANRGEPITVFFVNNAIYGMTGGQVAPTTPVGAKSTTTPFGRSVENEGYPLRVCELLAALEAPIYLERVALGNNKQITAAARAVKKALEIQVKGLGFSLVEILSPCPTVWKMTPVEAQRHVRDELAAIFPAGVYRDRSKDAVPWNAPARPPGDVRGMLGIAPSNGKKPAPPGTFVDQRIKIAGFGGQGVLLLGEILAEAGMRAGLEVSWLPSYGPEMRSGASNCSVRLSTAPLDSPVVSSPNVLMALNEPSLRKFLPDVEPGGAVFYNRTALPEDCRRQDVHFILRPFTELADELGDARAGNMVLLGAFLQMSRALPLEAVGAALAHMIPSERLRALDLEALERGRQLVKEILP
ncbi:MAG: 2-oxoacid:acceptor oxidoreductase family protein [Acidobacteria bacterium]|nr:2-oxoacid:acceptor oxidoreductase family protein [Acidobacteriota bacterium]